MSDPLPARDVVNGLWDTAPVLFVEQDGTTFEAVIKMGPDGTLAACLWAPWTSPALIGGHFDIEDDADLDYLHLVLPGPLGLGAAGLADRCWKRLGFKRTCHGIPRVVGAALREDGLLAVDRASRVGVPRAVLDAVVVPEAELLFDWTWRHLKVVSEWIARLDAICKALGIELEPGEVPGWEYTLENGWVLTARSGRHVVEGANHTDDPLEALGVVRDAREADRG